MSAEHVLTMLNEHEVKFVDLRFTDTKGKEQHVTIPSHQVNAEFFEEGKMFDGSSIGGWKGINESDMVLMPDASTAVIDPFYEEPTLIIRCDILEPGTLQGYDRDPRSIAKRAEEYLRATGIADTVLFGQNQNSSCSTTSALVPLSPAPMSRSMTLKVRGTPLPNTKAVTKVTVRA